MTEAIRIAVLNSVHETVTFLRTALAAPNEVLVTAAVSDLVSGSGSCSRTAASTSSRAWANVESMPSPRSDVWIVEHRSRRGVRLPYTSSAERLNEETVMTGLHAHSRLAELADAAAMLEPPARIAQREPAEAGRLR